VFKSYFLRKEGFSVRRRRYYGARPIDPLEKQAGPIEGRNPSAAGPQTYTVTREKGGFWYIDGLAEELTMQPHGPNARSNEKVWLNVDTGSGNLRLAEQIYCELYAEFQVNDALKNGDKFNTPVGVFICKGVDVLPYDEKAKKNIAAVDESYKCAFCGCDQGRHRKRYDDAGAPYYAECSDHPQCRTYKSRQTVK